MSDSIPRRGVRPPSLELRRADSGPDAAALECRTCGAGAPVDEHFCPNCSRILALGRHGDYFAFLGLPRRLTISAPDLEQRFRDLSRKFHPDYYYNAPPAERLASLERSSYLNDAYRALRNPVSRIEHLLAIEGLPSAKSEEGTARVPPALLEEVFASDPPAIIVADGLEPPPGILRYARIRNLPLISTVLPAARIIETLRLSLAKAVAQTTSMHGVFLDVLELGVLITGASAIGKSELALELISRGNGLIADDIVELYRISPDTLEGRCPAVLRDFLEVRGIGILNIRTIFGETAVRPRKLLKFMVHLEDHSNEAFSELDRLQVNATFQEILGVPVRKVTIPVAAGRNLAVLVEAAVRNFVLNQRGIDSTKEFIERQTQLMEDGG